MNRILLLLFLLFVVMIAVQSCREDEQITTPDYNTIVTISYSQHVQPLFQRSCATSGCHDNATNAAGLSLTNWQRVLKGSTFGNVLIPFRAEKSLLTYLFDGTSLRRQHPALSSALSRAEINFLKRWITEGAKNDDGAIPFEHSTRKVYVPNQQEDNVAVIDQDSLVVTRWISVGNSSAIEGPHFIVADNNFWYVSLINAGQVWKFDGHKDTVVKKANVFGAPALLALTPDGNKLYVSQFTSSSTNKISVVNTSTMIQSKTITVMTMPHGIRMNHAGSKVFVANMMSDYLSVIEVATDSVIAEIPLAYDANPFGPVKYSPMEVAVSPDDNYLLVTCSENNEVRMFDATTYALLDSFHVGQQPWHLQFTPDGNWCYVTNREGHSVSVLHIPMRHVMQTITSNSPRYFDYPHGCDISSNGKYIFISNENATPGYTPRFANDNIGNVCVIDAVLNQVVKVLEVGKMPTGLCVTQ
ncbi:MAG: beta-propeller fold lactonase family protein [Ignavibacteriae bacterium]|nr:beta-propeller fold lactonase family protein [Ignavibacteriota bacterium]